VPFTVGETNPICNKKGVSWAKQQILDAFEHKIKEERINKVELSMPKRLQNCLSRNGALTGVVERKYCIH